jgi:hypothetical protein
MVQYNNCMDVGHYPTYQHVGVLTPEAIGPSFAQDKALHVSCQRVRHR